MNLIISRKMYILITLINVIIFTILGGLFCRYLVIEKMERYDFLHMIKNKIESIVGKDNNRNYFIYMILFLHTLYSIIIFISLTFTPYIDIYIINVAIVIFVVYTNLEFKGCLLRKYEKMIFRDSDNYDPGELFPHLFFRLLSKIFNYEFNINDKVLFVMGFGLLLSILVLLRFIMLLRRNITTKCN